VSPLRATLLLVALAGSSLGAESRFPRLFPENHALAACPDTPIRLTFGKEPVLSGTGTLTVTEVAGGAVVDSLDLAAPVQTNSFGGRLFRYSPCTITGKTLSIQLHSHVLKPGGSYRVTVGKGVFESPEKGGLASDSGISWVFSVRPAPPAGSGTITVSSDGSGDFCTVQGAVDAVSDDNQFPVTVRIRKGICDGITYIGQGKNHIHLVGEDRRECILQGLNNDKLNGGRTGRALFGVDADDFSASHLSFLNRTPWKGSQAEALRINGKGCRLKECDFSSFQDTLLLGGSVHVKDCLIRGDVDFIWGEGAVFFEHCEIRALHDGYYLQSRNASGSPGYVFSNCNMTADPGVERCWLARIDADRFPFSSAAFLNCTMGGHVPREGWLVTGSNVAGLRFLEYGSRDPNGRPLDVSGRHPASRQISPEEIDSLSDPLRVLSSVDGGDGWKALSP